MPSRNLAAEKNAVDVFAKTKGKLPNNSQDWADVHKMAYPTINDLPDEFKATEAASYYAVPGAKPPAPNPTGASIAAPPTAPLPQDSSNIPGLKNDVTAAQTNLDQLSSPNSALNILQEAIKTKTQSAKAPIGESSIFQQAGVGGFGALSNSLAARGTELSTNATDFKNIIGQMAGTYKDMASTAMTRYEAARDAYNKEVDRIQKIQDDLRDNEQAIKLAKLQHDMQMDLARFNKNNPSVSEQISAADKGLEINNGVVTDPSKGIVNGFDIGRYATDPNHERAVASIVQGIGKFNTISDVENYIKKKYPNSPVTGDMISKASEKYGVPWEMLVAMMEQDSSLGTAGKGARTFNPGNVGNDDAGNIRNYGDWQSGVNAVAAWLDKHRAKQSSSSGKFTPEFYSTTEGQKVRDDERALMAQFNANPITKDYTAVQSQEQEINSIVNSKMGGPGDLAVVYSFMKGLDPTSVVRESEYDSAAKSGNIFSGALARFNGYLKPDGGQLPENVKQEFLKIIQSKLAVKKKSYDQYVKETRDLAARQGMNPDNVTVNYTLQGASPAAAPDQSPAISSMSSDWDSTFGTSNSTSSGVK
jgi:hypothetical protein